MPSVPLPPHRHCKRCKAPIPEDKWYCSEECETAARVDERGSSRKMLLFYGLAIAALVGLWLLTIFI
ncbi:DUF2116 family Zn-ribbon domain-containing protein [Methanomassiliicoccus luminyensis]|jgi:predicted nucleic acid-binding Zn ribbon protein|uniref:DUF2116 family Zn-ribbon domain-containing protein n=1 Tax=Methanomassiliicoccus luminyensis TaxID=1080712 RepID=UPI000376CF6E|nr:DUF2116 family Zn-ribbon domain-containing protein [Methanomassiliicoccus luminyensis]